MIFFSDENHQKILSAFLLNTGLANINDKGMRDRLDISRQIISHIQKSPQDWDDRCEFNIKHVGAQFLQSLSNYDLQKPNDVDHIYAMSYRFLCEFDFLVGPDKELGMDLRLLRNRVQQDSLEMDGSVRSQIIYASYVMPANIAKEFINDANIGVFRSFELKKAEAEGLKNQWDGEISSKKEAVDELKDKLEEYKIGFNFVGLYQGFSDLSLKKTKESLWLFVSLIGMGLLMLAPLVGEVAMAFRGSYGGEPLGLSHLMILLPLISIEIILVYFFRVILMNHRSVKGQITQIELRQTLCQFIQSYADYSVKIKQQDSAALEKFENLIFSGILSNPEKMPSTFDGLGQIVNLVKSVKSP